MEMHLFVLGWTVRLKEHISLADKSQKCLWCKFPFPHSHFVPGSLNSSVKPRTSSSGNLHHKLDPGGDLLLPLVVLVELGAVPLSVEILDCGVQIWEAQRDDWRLQQGLPSQIWFWPPEMLICPLTCKHYSTVLVVTMTAADIGKFSIYFPAGTAESASLPGQVVHLLEQCPQQVQVLGVADCHPSVQDLRLHAVFIDHSFQPWQPRHAHLEQ